MRPFQINIGPRNAPRISFGAMAASSMEAVEEWSCLAQRGERIEVTPLRGESFPVKVARHHLEEVRLIERRQEKC